MKNLKDCINEIHSCSKCGLCQSVCPIYKITGNDCTVSRGHFIMLRGLIKGELKLTKTINKYLDMCLKCSACSKFCPSGIDVVDIIALAKAEYFKLHKIEKLKSYILKTLINLLNIFKIFAPKITGKHFDKKVIYFGGCSAKISGNKDVVKIFNNMGIEVISPDFDCCGFPFFVRGDMQTFEEYMNKFYAVLQNYDNYEIVTNCATCEKTLKSFSKWSNNNKNIVIKNVYEYFRENNFKPELKKTAKVTFHKPCNLNNFDDVKWILNNTKNLEYIEMKDFDKCCGFEGITHFKERNTLSKLFKEKHQNIKSTKAKIVLTSCLACEMSLRLFSLGKYKVMDLLKFISKNMK